MSEISNGIIMESRDATFFENIFPLKNKLSKSVCDTSCSNYHVVVMLIRPLFFNLGGVKDLKKVNDFGSQICSFQLEDDPKTYGEAMRSIDAPFWKEAINDEMSSLKNNKTWFLTDLPLVVKV